MAICGIGFESNVKNALHFVKVLIILEIVNLMNGVFLQRIYDENGDLEPERDWTSLVFGSFGLLITGFLYLGAKFRSCKFLRIWCVLAMLKSILQILVICVLVDKPLLHRPFVVSLIIMAVNFFAIFLAEAARKEIINGDNAGEEKSEIVENGEDLLMNLPSETPAAIKADKE